MAQVGNTTTPTAGFSCQGSDNEVWSSFTMPTGGGTLTTLHAYFGTFTGSGTCKICVWDGSGNLLGSTSIAGVGSASCAAGAQAWQSGSCSIFVPAGGFYMGFWTPTANGFSTSSESGGASVMTAAGSSPSSTLPAGTNTGIGALGVYADYTPGGVAHVRRTGAWSAGVPPKVRRSGAWTTASNTQARRTGVWHSGT